MQTTKGVKAPDVAWHSDEFRAIHGEETPFLAAPEIRVEILSSSNATAEMAEKKQLYFEAGANEVWFCDLDSKVTFHAPTGELERSTILPEFPGTV